jgi:AraC-like DNA-binding protein
MLFDLSGGSGASARLVGTMTAPFLSDAADRVDLLGVRFRPGESFALIGVPVHQATDRIVPLEDALGAVAGSLADELSSLPDAPSRISALDGRLTLLRDRARAADPRVRRAVRFIERSPAFVRVAHLARDVGLSERQLERAFALRVGVGPKALLRVARLQALLPQLERIDRAPWAALAFDLGYADQAHMIREVRRLAGMSPAALARQRSTMSDLFNSPLA